jgi:phosphoglycolate phosphatase-like HAD superfamily hydrolase
MSSIEEHSGDNSVRTTEGTVYCFDFDGVLCDTLDESLVTSYSAYFNREAKSVSEIDPALRDFFYEHRYLVRPAGEYYLLFYAFQRGETFIGKERFLQLKITLAQEMTAHAERFYAYRKRLQKDQDYWLSLHRFYPQCIDFLEKRRNPFFIVTNKDRISVVTLAKRFGFIDRIIEIYSKEISVDKKILMEKLIRDHGIDPTTHPIVYVDDHEGTLGEMRELPLDLYLASWGYTGKPQSSPFRLIQSLGELP